MKRKNAEKKKREGSALVCSASLVQHWIEPSE
jgi:hypothetical protein